MTAKPSTPILRAGTPVAAIFSTLLLGACAEPRPTVPAAAQPAHGSFTGPVAPAERGEEREEQAKDLVLDGASVKVPGWFEAISAECLEALRLDMGGRDPARQVAIAVMRAPKGQASTVVQISHTGMSTKSSVGKPVRAFLEWQMDEMKKTMIHPDEQILQFGTTPSATAMDFSHTARIKKPSGDVIQLYTRGSIYVTTDGRVVRSQVECVAEPTVAERLCVPILRSWKLTSPPSVALDAVIPPAP